MTNSTINDQLILTSDFIARCRFDPVIFSKTFCKFYPHWYQRKILRDHTQNMVVRMGRQMGKTSVTAIKALWYAFTRPDAQTKNEKVTIVIVAPSQRQSKIMYDQIRAYAHAHPLLEKSITKSTLEKIELKNNSVIHNFPVGDSAEKVRGFSINMLIVDEAAYIRERIYTAILPSLASTNGKLILIGTPAARSGLFFTAFYPEKGSEELTLDFSKHWYPYSYALEVQKVGVNGVPLFDAKTGNPITQLNRNWLLYQSRSMPAGAFEQEYEAAFTDEAMNFFSRTDIIANLEDYQMEFAPDGTSTYGMGVDFAKYQDSYVAIVVKQPQIGPMKIAFIYEKKRRDYSETVAKTIEIAKRFRCRFVFCDSTGVGEPNVEVLRKELTGISKVEGINMTSLKLQNDMYANISRLLGDGMLKLPMFARELRQQLGNVIRTLTPQGKTKIEAPGGHHDDYCDSLALACMITQKQSYAKLFVEPVSSLFGSIRRDVHKSTQARSSANLQQIVVRDRQGRVVGRRAVKRPIR